MAGLGWLLNLDFAGSGVPDSGVGPAIGSLLLLGVGRGWWVPLIWPWITGATYGGEMDLAIEIVSYLSAIGAGALGLYGFNRYREYQKKKHAPPPKPFVDDKVRPHVIGSVGGPSRVCPTCGSKGKTLQVLSNGHRACNECLKAAQE